MKKSQGMFDLESLAASQWGMFTTAQAQNLGVRRNQIARMVEAGRVEMAAYGVYRFCAGDEPELVEVKAAWLSVFPNRTVHERMSSRPYDAIVAGKTAAFVHGAGDFLASPYTFAVTQRKQTSRGDMLYLKREIEEKDVVFVASLPVTSFERTVRDLVAMHEDPELIDKFIQDASRSVGHQFDLDRLAELLAPLAQRNGFKKMDGRAFASDLLRRNSAAIQMERAVLSLEDAFRPYGSEQMDLVRKAIAESGVFEQHAETMRKIQEAVIQSGAAARLQDAVKDIPLPDIGSVPGVESALKSMSALKDIQVGNWAKLIAAAMPTIEVSGQVRSDGE